MNQKPGMFTQWNTTQQKERRIPTFSEARMELESILLSGISQVAKDKYHMISPIKGT